MSYFISSRQQVKEFNSELGEQTIKQIMHIKRCLVDRYRKEECSPMDYFEFVIDPDSFAKTVENMFHVSFLIKVSETNIRSRRKYNRIHREYS